MTPYDGRHAAWGRPRFGVTDRAAWIALLTFLCGCGLEGESARSGLTGAGDPAAGDLANQPTHKLTSAQVVALARCVTNTRTVADQCPADVRWILAEAVLNTPDDAGDLSGLVAWHLGNRYAEENNPERAAQLYDRASAQMLAALDCKRLVDCSEGDSLRPSGAIRLLATYRLSSAAAHCVRDETGPARVAFCEAQTANLVASQDQGNWPSSSAYEECLKSLAHTTTCSSTGG